MTERARRVLLLGGNSEIGVAILHALRLPRDSDVVLAGRDLRALGAVADSLSCDTSCVEFDALHPDSVTAVFDHAFARGPVDLVIPAFGVLGDQSVFDGAPAQADALMTVNVVAQTRALLEAAARLRGQGSGTVIVLSSIAAARPRRANFVYGASKAALDAAARGLADSLSGTGVRVLLVRPGFVVGRMTQGMKPAPLATTPEAVGSAVVQALTSSRSVVWVPGQLRLLAGALRLIPRPLWRRLRR